MSWHRKVFLSSQQFLLTRSVLIRNLRGERLLRIQNTALLTAVSALLTAVSALLTAVSALNELFESRQISYICIVHFMLFTMCIFLHSVLQPTKCTN